MKVTERNKTGRCYPRYEPKSDFRSELVPQIEKYRGGIIDPGNVENLMLFAQLSYRGKCIMCIFSLLSRYGDPLLNKSGNLCSRQVVNDV